MLLVPFFGFITALGFAAFGIAVAATVAKIDQFNYVTTLVITPLFLVAGTFFPIDQLPEGFQVAAQFNPLYQLVELVRGAAFGFEAVDARSFRRARRLLVRALADRGEQDDQAARRLRTAPRLELSQPPPSPLRGSCQPASAAPAGHAQLGSARPRARDSVESII